MVLSALPTITSQHDKEESKLFLFSAKSSIYACLASINKIKIQRIQLGPTFQANEADSFNLGVIWSSWDGIVTLPMRFFKALGSLLLHFLSFSNAFQGHL